MRIGLLRKQQLFAEFVNSRWRIWYIYINDITSGTYYELYEHGQCDRVTTLDGDVVSIDRICDGQPIDTDVVAEQQAHELEFYLNYSL